MSHLRRCSWALLPLILWLCVSATVNLGLYGRRRMSLGAGASRLLKAGSVFVEQVEVRDDEKRGVILYGFDQEPELDCESEWNVTKYLALLPYGRKGFSLWLNRGSTVRLQWEGPARRQLQSIVLKGEEKREVLQVKTLRNTGPFSGMRAEYLIKEDDHYFVGLKNANPRKNIASLTAIVTFKKYNLTKSTSSCSTDAGSCRIKLSFPVTNYVVMTAPINQAEFGMPSVDVSFLRRIVSYIILMFLVSLAFYFTLKCLGVCGNGNSSEETPRTVDESTSESFLPVKPSSSFNTAKKCDEEEDDDGASSCSSEDLYDAKLCVICYDEQRNCFFIPCGHCATCYECAQRIMDGENKVCPICRRLIHKARRLFTS